MSESAARAKIRRLPDAVVRQIAAGEVVERPASVLKELVENSLDAGAGKVQVESLGAGRKLLRVADDGSGMAPEDCRLAFERHATSKIADIEDLDRLSTFGFRGEALFSVAAVSRVTLTSCARPSAKGWSVDVDGGKISRERPAPPVSGTTIEVRDLFFNTPARAKFLKSDPSEKGHLSRVIEEAALAHPEASFSYKSENRSAFQWAADKNGGSKSRERRIADVLGDDFEGLLSVSEARGDLKLMIFLAPADRLSPSRNFQFFFINRRPVTSRLLQQALYRAYEPFRSRDRHPVAVAYLEIPPDQFDVNVHPAKREVRFRSERPLFDFIYGALSGALLRSKGIPTIVPRSQGNQSGPLAADIANDRSIFPSAWEASARLTSLPPGGGSDVRVRGPETPYLAGISPASREPAWYAPPLRYLGQIEQTYLVFDAAGGLLVVDQHAAQERIFFERYRSEIESGKVRSQKLMLPLPVELPASQIQRVLARAEELDRIGFDVRAFGKTTLHVTAAPALLHKAADLKETVHRLLDEFQPGAAAAADVLHHAAATVACKAAVKAHDRLSSEEALRLVEDLRGCRDGTACPHGRPSMIALNREELARRFKRPGAPPLS